VIRGAVQSHAAAGTEEVAEAALTVDAHRDVMIWALATRVGLAVSEVAKGEAADQGVDQREVEALATTRTLTFRWRSTVSARLTSSRANVRKFSATCRRRWLSTSWGSLAGATHSSSVAMSATLQLSYLLAFGRHVRTAPEVVAEEGAHRLGVTLHVAVQHDLLVPAATHGTVVARMVGSLMEDLVPLEDLAEPGVIPERVPMPFPWEGRLN